VIAHAQAIALPKNCSHRVTNTPFRNCKNANLLMLIGKDVFLQCLRSRNPSLLFSTRACNCVIHKGRCSHVEKLSPLSEISMRGYLFHMSAESAYFFWEHLGTFLVRDGKEIIVDPLPGVEECLVRLPFCMAMAVAASTGFLCTLVLSQSMASLPL